MNGTSKKISLLFIAFCLSLASCTAVDKDKASLVLRPASYSDLPGWRNDDQQAAFEALARSCLRILKRSPEDKFGPDDIGGTYGDWQPACRALPVRADAETARAYFETWFTPYRATFDGKEDTGLFTG